MIFVELFRLVLVLALTAAGYRMGQDPPSGWIVAGSQEATLLVYAVVGAGVGYVGGGILGRFSMAAIGAVERRVDRVAAAEILVGVIGLMLGAITAAIASVPILRFVRLDIVAYTLVALIFLLTAYGGYRISIRKRSDVLGLMGLTQDRTFSPTATRGGTGARVLDTSSIIDGRILDVVKSGFLSGRVICPRFVLAEMQSIADSGDEIRRAKGKRGLEILQALQSDPRVRLEVSEDDVPEMADVDAKLVSFAKRIEGVLVTTDFNLHRVAELQGVLVLNVNGLAASLRPQVIAGEAISVKIVKQGTNPGQGVGYLPDGTMVVVEGAAAQVGEDLEVQVTSVLQTPAGRMLFAAFDE